MRQIHKRLQAGRQELEPWTRRAKLLHGIGYDEDVMKRIEKGSDGVQAVVTARATIEALQELGVKKIAVGSPYPIDVRWRLLPYLSEGGFEVVDFVNADPPMSDFSSEGLYKLVKAADHPGAEAIFVSGTLYNTAPVIEQLEQEVKKPVITANLATFWASLRALGLQESMPGSGTLLREHLAVVAA